MGQELLLNVRIRADLVHDLSIFKDEHGRNATDAESRTQGFVLVDIDLGDFGLWPDV